MKVVTSVAVPDYVYQFYSKVAQDIGDIRTEDIMERALTQYAYLVSKDILRQDESGSEFRSV